MTGFKSDFNTTCKITPYQTYLIDEQSPEDGTHYSHLVTFSAKGFPNRDEVPTFLIHAYADDNENGESLRDHQMFLKVTEVLDMYDEMKSLDFIDQANYMRNHHRYIFAEDVNDFTMANLIRTLHDLAINIGWDR